MNGSGERAGSTRPGVLGDRNLRRVEVELVQRSVRVVAGAVRVVRPGRPERAADEGSVRVVAGVVALVLRLLRPDQVNAAGVGASTPVPREIRLGVDRAIGLRRDEVETADVAMGGEDRLRKARRTKAVWIDGGVDVRSTLTV